MKRKTAEELPSVNTSSGTVTITAEQYREYKELQAKRDRSLSTLRTQARLQEAEWSENALWLARTVNSALVGGMKCGVVIVNNNTAEEALELANEILARE